MMMNNIFSIFDPSSTLNLSLNWLGLLLIPMMIFPYQFWFIPSRFTMTWYKIFNFVFNKFKILISFSYSNLIFISLFSFIFINNFMGLFPYIFTSSSHMSFCLSSSLTLWLSMIIFSLINYFNETMSHLTPQSTPSILMPFMVIIESISLLIRPITLAIRLTANMIAGHFLLSLLGSSAPALNNSIIFITMIMSQTMLMILEISVSIIQAYVFAILSSLYSSEI